MRSIGPIALFLVLGMSSLYSAQYTGGSYGGYASAKSSPQALFLGILTSPKFLGGSYDGYDAKISPVQTLFQGILASPKFLGGSYDGYDAKISPVQTLFRGTLTGPKFLGGSYDGFDSYKSSRQGIGGPLPNYPIFVVSRDSFSFGPVLLGSSAKDSVTVTNGGGVPLIISSVTSNNSLFTVSPTVDTIGSLVSHEFVITFSPLSIGPQTAHIKFTHNAASSPDSVRVDGYGATPGSISGTVFTDTNGNGIREVGDTAQVGWTIHLDGPVHLTSVSDVNGLYSFTGILPGAYTVSEDVQSGWIQTFPYAPKVYSLNLGSGGVLIGTDFGNTFGYKYVGPNGGNWDDGQNWVGHDPPGPLSAVLVPEDITILVDSLPSDSILALKISRHARLKFLHHLPRLRLKQLFQMDSSGVLEFPVDDNLAGLICYRDWISKGNVNPGLSTITFLGDTKKVIISQSIDSTRIHFYNLEILGDSTSVIGNISIQRRLTILHDLPQRLQDTLSIDTSDVHGIQGPGIIPMGTIVRSIAPTETTAYRFESQNTFVRFDGSGTSPSSVAMTVIPDSTPPEDPRVCWEEIPGTLDSVNHFITTDPVNHLSKWGFGIKRPTRGASPAVQRLYTIDQSGGANFGVVVQLRYEAGELLPSIAQADLQLFRLMDCAPMRIPVKPEWNLLSVPINVSDYRKTSLFPRATSSAFAYAKSYVVRDTLEMGKGYWMKFAGIDTASITGSVLTNGSISVLSGWNLIGSISYPVRIATIASNPGGIVTSNFFGYNTGYFIADTLMPGEGYWVKVNQSGTLALNSFSASPNAGIKIVPTNERPPGPPSEEVMKSELPKEYALEQNYPNPFNPVTVIRYALPVQSHVRLVIYNVLGQEVKRLVDETQEAGFQTREWVAGSVASGVYFYRFEAVSVHDPRNRVFSLRKMVLIR